MHHSQCQRSVAAGTGDEDPIGGSGSMGFVGVDQPDIGAPLLCLVHSSQHMNARGGRIDPP